MKMVERTRSLLKDAILIDPGWALQDPMKHPGSLKLRSEQSVPTPFLSGLNFEKLSVQTLSRQGHRPIRTRTNAGKLMAMVT
jgi:hypothetical protein